LNTTSTIMESRKVMVFPTSAGGSPESRRLLRMMEKAGLKTALPGEKLNKEELTTLVQESDIILLSAREQDLPNNEKSWEQNIGSIQHIPLAKQKQMVVWCDLKTMTKLCSSEGLEETHSIQEVFPNIHFHTHKSMLKLVDDLRTMHKDLKVESDPGICDITLIANATDDVLLDKTSIILEGTRKIECIRVDSSDGKEYEALCSDALQSSRMVVILVGVASDWAINFTRHLWKNNGGASSRTPLAVLFNKQHGKQANELKIPGVQVLLTDDTMAGLEILVAFDRNMASINE
jgi:hypothetical protein